MRTRLIVAFAAIMAAAALVVVASPAGSRAHGDARTADARTAGAATNASTTFTPVWIPQPADAAAEEVRPDAPSTGPADRPERDAVFVEPGTRVTPVGRASVAQPRVRARVAVKNYWRHDPDISWYGPGFFGNGTACGQRYTRTIMGVAHRTLPCGTLVTFRNPANGRQVTVPVIDRGPYVAGRTWDMSRAMCDHLDHCHTGAIEWRWGGKRGG